MRGADIADSLGFTFSSGGCYSGSYQRGRRERKPRRDDRWHASMMRGGGKKVGEYITDLDLDKYLNYVVSTQPLKGVPSFDSYKVDGAAASGENGEFGNEQGSDVNFTAWAAAKTGSTLSEELKENVRLLNPMYFIGDGVSSVAPHWYIRHGARDRDTAFPIAIESGDKAGERW